MVPERSKAKRIVSIVRASLRVLVLVALTALVLWYVTVQFDFWDIKITSADVKYDDLGRFLIVEETRDIIEWRITLYWEKNRHFMGYYIDHDSDYGRRMGIHRSGARIIVTDHGTPIGELNTDDGSFLHIPFNHLAKQPMHITIGGPRGIDTKTVDSYSPLWNEVYDRAMGRSPIVDPGKSVSP